MPVQPNETHPFTATAHIEGDVTFRDEDSMRIWLATSIGTVPEGSTYEGTQVLSAGSKLVFYIRRDGEEVGTAAIGLGTIVAAVMGAFERANDARKGEPAT